LHALGASISAGATDRTNPALPWTNQYPNLEESNELWRGVREGAPRAAGITAATFVESVLIFVVSNRLILRAPVNLERLMRSPSAPLHFFSDCIDLGIALGTLRVLHADLHGIRRVKNAFANTLKPISFDTPAVEFEINKMGYFAKAPPIHVSQSMNSTHRLCRSSCPKILFRQRQSDDDLSLDVS
jgi:hypothetical protein